MAIAKSTQYRILSLTLSTILADVEMYNTEEGLVWAPASLDKYYVSQGANQLFRNWEAEPQVDALGRKVGVVRNFVTVNFSGLNWQGEAYTQSFWLANEIRRNGFTLILPLEEGQEEPVKVKFSFYNIAPSKKRTARMAFVNAEIRERVIMDAGYGGKIAKQIVEAKVEMDANKGAARIGMHETGTDQAPVREPNTMLVPDYVFAKEMLTHRINLKDSENYKKDGLISYNVLQVKEITATDGASLMSPKYAIEVAYGKGILSAEQASYMLSALAKHERLATALSFGKFAKLWAKVPGAYQKRNAIDKGLDIVFDFAAYNPAWEGVDILVTPSQRKDKAAEGYETPYLVANWAKDLTERGFLCYLFIQNTGLTAEDLIELTSWGRNKVWAGRRDYAKMLEFFGAMHSMKQAEKNEDAEGNEQGFGGLDHDELDETLPTHVAAILAHPWLYTDKYVQDTYDRAVENFILDMGRGRIPVEGSWVYMAPDPIAFVNRANLFMADPEKYGFDWVDEADAAGNYTVNGCLEEGEFYCNGLEMEVVGFRSPMMRHTEPIVQKLVKKAELAGTKNVKLYPCHGADHEKQQGADFDGDRDFMTWNPVIIASVKRLQQGEFALITAESGKANKVVWNSDAHVNQDLLDLQNTAALGLAVNWNTTLIDWALHKGDRSICEEANIALTGLAAQIIDFAKTGYMPEIPEEYQVEDKFPHWREQTPSKKRKPYRSTSPMGQVYDFFHGVKDLWTGEVQTAGWYDNYRNAIDEDGTKPNGAHVLKHTVRIMNGMSRVEVYTLLGKVEAMQQAYGSEMADFEKLIRNGLIPGNTRKEQIENQRVMRKAIITKYSDMLYNLTIQFNVDIRNVFRTAYFVTYHKSAKRTDGPTKNGTTSVAFPWATVPAGLFATLDEKLKASGKRLVLVHGIEELELLEGVETLTVENGKVVIDGDVVAKAGVVDGEYQVWSHKDRYFLMVDDAEAILSYTAAPTNNKAQFRLTGFKFLAENFTAEDAAQRISAGDLLTFQWVDEAEGRSYLSVLHMHEKVGEVSQMRQMLDVMLLDGSTVRVSGHKVYSAQALIVDVELVKEGTRNTGARSASTAHDLVEGLRRAYKPSADEVMARVNMAASYWTLEEGESYARAKDFGITGLAIEWIDAAPGLGEHLANVLMTRNDATYVAEVFVSEEKVARNGRPELEVRGFKASAAAIGMILRFADYSHKELALIEERIGA